MKKTAKHFVPRGSKIFAVSALVLLTQAGCKSTYLMKGVGGDSCASVLANIHNDPGVRGGYASWLQGYLTRYNYENETSLGKYIDGGTLLNIATKHCRENPEDDFPAAAESVIEELKKES